MTDRSGHTRKRLPGWLVPAMLWLYFFGIAIFTATSHYSRLDLILLAIVYGLLAAGLGLTSMAVYQASFWFGAGASLVVGFFATWHLFEQFQLPAYPIEFAVSTVFIAMVFLVVLWFSKWISKPTTTGVAGLIAIVSFIGILLISHVSLETFRWHLLRQNQLIGRSMYHLLSVPVPAVNEALWEAGTTRESAEIITPRSTHLEGATKPRDIVFILIDTLRADALSAYGGDPSRMPRLNRFADESLVFKDVIVNASWTRPSMASYFTGLLQEQHGAVSTDDRLSEDHFTIAEFMHEAGYQTVAFVGNYAAVGKDSGFSQGYDRFNEIDRGEYAYARAEKITPIVTEWLERSAERDPNRPLWLYVHYVDPHSPYLAEIKGSIFHAQARRGYDAELRYLDEWLARLLEVVEAQLPGAIVMITSDHGEEFGEHGDRGHGRSLYSEVLSVPTILKTPDEEPGIVSDPLEARDFFDLLTQLSGTDLDVSEWAKKTGDRPRYASIYYSIKTAVSRPWKQEVSMRRIQRGDEVLIWSGYGITRELYDTALDPTQTKNLIAQRPESTEELEILLDSAVPRWADRAPARYSDENVEMLRKLGYVE